MQPCRTYRRYDKTRPQLDMLTSMYVCTPRINYQGYHFCFFSFISFLIFISYFHRQHLPTSLSLALSASNPRKESTIYIALLLTPHTPAFALTPTLLVPLSSSDFLLIHGPVVQVVIGILNVNVLVDYLPPISNCQLFCHQGWDGMRGMDSGDNAFLGICPLKTKFPIYYTFTVLSPLTTSSPVSAFSSSFWYDTSLPYRTHRLPGSALVDWVFRLRLPGSTRKSHASLP
ncbi:hypothetical protein F5B20DRAFT_263634 [Whalleya microplaca]|nr:hypothetical protein F5B20DRAFT_263634 [Whalleya microplaca]